MQTTHHNTTTLAFQSQQNSKEFRTDLKRSPDFRSAYKVEGNSAMQRTASHNMPFSVSSEESSGVHERVKRSNQDIKFILGKSNLSTYQEQLRYTTAVEKHSSRAPIRKRQQEPKHILFKTEKLEGILNQLTDLSQKKHSTPGRTD